MTYKKQMKNNQLSFKEGFSAAHENREQLFPANNLYLFKISLIMAR